MKWSFILLLIISAITITAEDLNYSIKDVKVFSPKGWGEKVQEEDKVSYREVIAKEMAWLEVPNWWGDTIRPANEKIYCLEITYKDILKAPAKVMAFTGNGRYQSMQEIHRIGGENDGKWKVAIVPLSWDLIMLPAGSKNARIGFHPFTDENNLPVSNIKIRDAKLPDDRIRYDEETRAWVKKVQAPLLEKARYVAADQIPAIPDKLKNEAIVPFVRSYYDAIELNSAPQKKEAGGTAFIKLAQNEFEPCTFGVYANLEDLAEVSFSVSALKNGSEELDCNVNLQAAEYTLKNIRDRSKKEATFFTGWTPQRLWPVYKKDIKKGQSSWYWITVQTKGEKSKPGTYTGTINITSNKHKASLPIKVEVLPFKLLTMDEANLKMGGCISGYPTEREMRVMLEHNHNMLNLWYAGVQPEIENDNGKMKLSYYYLDDFMKRAADCGQKAIVWFLGGNPNGYPGTNTIEYGLFDKFIEGGREEYYKSQGTLENRGKIQPRIDKYYRQLISDLTTHANEKKWPELILTPFDEPVKWAYETPKEDKNYKHSIGCGLWTRDHFKAACKLIHESCKNKVYISMHHNYDDTRHGIKGRVGEIFIEDIDIVCTNAIDEDADLGNKTRKAGKDFWQYGGLHGRRYNFGFYFSVFDSRGSLAWAYNWANRFDTSSGGTDIYAWYTAFDVIVTPQYEELREAWDDRRYLETAKSIAKQKGVDISPLIKKINDEVLANRGNGGRDLVNDFWEEATEANLMDKWRNMLIEKIVEMNK